MVETSTSRWFKLVLLRSTVGNLHPVWTWDRTGLTEEEAKVAKMGMWGLRDKYVSPKEWRRTHGN
jgi:hypothetical protein